MAARPGWSILLAALAGCTSVKLVQRDGCWIRQTSEKPFGGVREELGPCTSPEPPWAEDRLTRLVQECASRADRRWESRALAAWSRGEPFPDKVGPDDILQVCTNESARALLADLDGAKAENDSLRKQLAKAAAERDAMRANEEREREAARAREDRERADMLATSAKLADHLGEAAKKAQQPASATATARSEQVSDTTHPPGTVTVVSPLSGASQPVTVTTPVTVAPGAPATAPKPAVKKPAAADAAKPEAPRRARRPNPSAPECVSPGANPIPSARSTCPDP